MAQILCGWVCLDPSNGLFDRILALVKTILTVARGNIHVNVNTCVDVLGYTIFYLPPCPSTALSSKSLGHDQLCSIFSHSYIHPITCSKRLLYIRLLVRIHVNSDAILQFLRVSH